jgi:hypothetical protein
VRTPWCPGPVSLTFAGPKVTLPVAVTVFPKDIPRAPRSWIEIPVS